MLLLMIERGMPIDIVLTADTGMEFPEMYDHLAKLDEYLYRERGIHLTMLRHPKGFEYMMFEEEKQKISSIENRQKLGVPLYGNGWPGVRVRWCTGQLKTHLIAKEVNRLKGKYRQYRRARRLVHECCNYDGGNCIALDDGEECVCVQSISYSLLCRWFRAAVLPQDKELETALFHRLDAKRCAVCGALFTPGSNRAKYCPECAGRMKRIKAAQRKRKQRAKCHALGAENPL